MSIKKHADLNTLEGLSAFLASVLANVGPQTVSQGMPNVGANQPRKATTCRDLAAFLRSLQLMQAQQSQEMDSTIQTRSVSPAVISQKGFLRLKQIIGDPKANPPIPAIYPICKSSFWAGVKSGRYPHGIKLSPRVTVWRAEEIFALVASEGKVAK